MEDHLDIAHELISAHLSNQADAWFARCAAGELPYDPEVVANYLDRPAAELVAHQIDQLREAGT